MFRVVVLGSVLFSFTLMFAGETNKTSPVLPSYELILLDSRWPDRPFLVEVPAENREGIKTLESYIKDGVTVDKEGNFNIGIVLGKVQRTKKTKSHQWSFKFDPNTIVFGDAAIEVCDASFMYIEKDVDEWIQSVGQFCPWSTARWVKSIKKIWSRPVGK